MESLSDRQKKIYNLLELNQDKSSIAYLGAIRVLQDEMNPDRFHQAANSIRHIGALITRSQGRGKQSKPKEFSRKLKSVLTEELEFLHPDIINNIENSIGKWQELQDYFIPIAHYSKDNFSNFEEKFIEFEDILIEILKTSGERKKILKFLLNIEQPKQRHIDLLKTAILFLSDANFFFNKLKNPNWLEILKRNQFFSSPTKEFSKHFNISSWPQANYLISISYTKGREILQIFSEFKDFNNFLIFRRFLLCTLNMPIDTARDSLYLINLWARKIMPDTELMTLQKLFIKFVKGSEFDGALRLLEIVFNFHYPEKKIENYPQYNKYFLLLDNSFGDFKKTLMTIEDGDFRYKFIHILSKCLSEAIRSEITQYIKTGEKNDGIKERVTPEMILFGEHSEYLKQSIETQPETYESKSVVNLLIDNIRDYTLSLYSLNQDVFKTCAKSFLKFKWKTFTRLFLFMLDKHYDFLKKNLSEILKRKDIFEGNSCWHEYFHLLKNHFSNFQEEEKRIIFNWIEEGPKFNYSETTFRNETEYEQYKTRFINAWRKKRINPIINYLPEKLLVAFKPILSDSKNLEHPDYVRIRTGPSVYWPSDRHLKNIKDMDIGDQIDYLKNYNLNDERTPFLEGREGLGEAYSLLIKGDPSKYISLIQNFKEIPAKLLPDIIDGFRKALEENNLKDVKLVIVSFNYICNSRASFDDWEVFFRIEFEIVKFIEVVLKTALAEFVVEHYELIWSLILPRSKVPEFKKYSEQQHSHISPLGFYLYTINGLRLYNMIVFIEILQDNSKERQKIPLSIQLFKIIDELLDSNLDEGELTRAILGYRFDTLLRINKPWVQERLVLIFPEDKASRSLWDVAWESYISTHYFSIDHFSLLKSQYKKGINRLKSSSRNITYNGRKSLISHLINAYLMEVVNLDNDSLIERLFIDTNPTTRTLVWQILSNFLESIFKIEDAEKRESLLKKYYELLDYRVNFLRKNTKIEYKDILIELQPFEIIFSKILKFNEEHLKLLNVILELTKGNSGVFTSDMLVKLKNSVEVNSELVLLILNKLTSSKNQSIWLDERTAGIIFDIITTTKGKEVPQQLEILVKKISEAMWNRGFHQFSIEK